MSLTKDDTAVVGFIAARRALHDAVTHAGGTMRARVLELVTCQVPCAAGWPKGGLLRISL